MQNIPLPLNFDSYTFRASSAGKITGEAKSKSSSSKLEKKIQEIEALNLEINSTDESKKSAKAYLNKLDKLEAFKLEKHELEVAVKMEKSGAPILPDTCISYLIECYIQAAYSIKKDIHSKYFEKGLAKEDEAIEFLSDYHGNFYTKCDLPRQFNEFFEGECDIIFVSENGKRIIDIKNSWNLFTFFNAKVKETNDNYRAQGIVYMKLYGANSFQLCYLLMNMPVNLQLDECKRILYDYGSEMQDSPEYDKATKEFFKTCNFDTLLPSERIYDDIIIEMNSEVESEYASMCQRVIDCRRWLNFFAMKEHQRIYGKIEGINFFTKVNIIEDEVEVIVEEKPQEAEKNSEQEAKPVAQDKQKSDDDVKKRAEFLSSLVKKAESTGDLIDIYESDIQHFEGNKQLMSELRKKSESFLIPKIEDCKSKVDLENLYEKDEQLILISEKLADAMISKNEIIANEEKEPNITLKLISKCTSDDQCIDLWKASIKVMKEFPEIKKALIEKRNSFSEPQEAAKEDKPKPQRPTQNPPKVIVKEEEVKEVSEEEKTFLDIKEKCLKIENADSLKAFYKTEDVFNFLNSNGVKPNPRGVWKKEIESILAKLINKENEK